MEGSAPAEPRPTGTWALRRDPWPSASVVVNFWCRDGLAPYWPRLPQIDLTTSSRLAPFAAATARRMAFNVPIFTGE